ncbi:MAG: TRAP transporter permease [Alphaproteobacteria bacterium]|nr:TRAP transporter permease [Alphaproteobacteria bacterium]
MAGEIKPETQAASISADDIVAEADTGARSPSGATLKAFLGLAIAWSVFQLWIASPLPTSIGTIDLGFVRFNLVFNDSITRPIHLSFAGLLCFLAFPALKRSPRSRVPIKDWVMGGLLVIAAMYPAFFQAALAERVGAPILQDIVVALFGVILLLEATRRALGPPLMIVACVFVLYSLFGRYVPGSLAHGGQSLAVFTNHQWLTQEGVFGVALGVSTDYVFLFVLFGALLDKAGAGNYFIKLAFSLLGSYRGGPAKAAVVSSGMTGLISGSSIANVVTTGTFTIPLMKRVGFSSEKAGAIEVAASTNGQLTPPVMGAAAFLMVEYVGISYFDVITHAFLPAIISYIALVYIVHLEALKADMKGLPKPGTPKPWQRRLIGLSFNIAMVAGLGIGVYYLFGWMPGVFGAATPYAAGVIILAIYLALVRYAASVPDLELDDPDAPVFELPVTKEVVPTGLHFILPIVVLVYCLMVLRWSPGLSAFWATVILIFIILTQRPLVRMFRKEGDFIAGFRQGFAEFVDGLIAGARNMIGIGVAVAAAGIIVGAVTETSVGLKLAEIVEYLSFGSVFIMLIWTAVLCIVLGLGLPTTANYIVVSAIMAPVIVVVGQQNGLIVPLIAVHLFVFYFGILADDTPPVGLAAFAAAAVSGGDPIKTGIQGFMYDIRTAVLPFMFIFNTELLLIDVGVAQGIYVFVIAVIAILCFAAATQGYFLTRSKAYETAVLLLVALTFFRPGLWMDILVNPWDKVAPDKLMQTVAKAEVGTKIRFFVGTETDAGKPFDKYVEFKVQAGKDAAARLKKYGVTIIKEDGQWIVDRVEEGSAAKKIDQQPSDEIKAVFKPADQPPKQLFYIPAILLLLLVVMMQRRRMRPGDAKGAGAGAKPATATA